MPMHLELLVNNDLRVLAATRAYAREALRQTSMASPEIEKLVELIERSVRAAIEHAYPSGEDGSIKVGITDSRGKLVVTVRDYGMPQDIETLERQVHEPDHPNPRLFGISCQGIADEVHWLGYGPEGKALQIVKWLHNTHITAQVPEDALATFRDDASLAPEQQYTIRRIAADEAVQVSQLIYRAYGGTYLNRDVYYPERVAAENEREIVLSFAAQGEDGRLVGHYALERSQEGPVAEGGQAVVDPAHRGRGLGETVCRKATELAREDGRLVQPRVNSTGKSLLVRADRDGNALFVLVNEGNQVQGLASVVGTPTGEDGGTLLQLCVHPACREGALPLAARAVDWAHDQGMTGLLSYTGPLDAIAREYLATCGFEPAGTVPSDTSIEKWTRPR